jgi:hypothetical protein
MQKWEYQSFPAVVNEGLGDHLNAVGNDGWEVIQLIEAKPVPDGELVYWVVCKRPRSQAFHSAT